MEIREIKKEVANLANLQEEARNLRKNWLKPVRANTNKHMPFLQKLDSEAKKQLNLKLVAAHQHLVQIERSQIINDKLNNYSQYIVELKLAEFRGKSIRTRTITNKLLHDDFLSMKNTLIEVKAFQDNLIKFSDHYEEINKLLHKELSLDEALFFRELPHLKYLYNLLNTAKDQNNIARDLGRHFISLVKKHNLGQNKK